MKTMTVGEFKSHFAYVLELVKSGESFAVTYGKKKEIVGYFLPESQLLRPKRQLGLLEGKAKVNFKTGYKMSEEELLG